MDRGTKWASYITAAVAAVGAAGMIWMAWVGQSGKLATAARGGIEGLWEVGISVIAAVWLVWGWRRKPAEKTRREWGDHSVPKMKRRTKIGLAATGGLVALTIALLCLFGNGPGMGAEDMREFTLSTEYGMIGAIVLTWGIWWWVGKRG